MSEFAKFAPISDFTSVSHHHTYPAIDPKRPELSQVGRTVLITGGGTNIGKAIAEAFATASAKSVVIVGRRVDVLEAAATELESHAKSINSPTQFFFRGVDVSKNSEVDGLWTWIGEDLKLEVDVLVLNAAAFGEAKQLKDLGIDELWRQFEVNVKGPLYLAEKFQKQFKNEKPKALLHVTSAAAHMPHNAIVASRPSYSLTKATASFAMQQIADSVDRKQLQVINFHPGMIYATGWEAFGITKDDLPFDEVDLPGSFAVWSTSEEAHFLHGRFVHANWDVTELAQVDKKTLEENPDFLRVAVIGLRDAFRA